MKLAASRLDFLASLQTRAEPSEKQAVKLPQKRSELIPQARLEAKEQADESGWSGNEGQ